MNANITLFLVVSILFVLVVINVFHFYWGFREEDRFLYDPPKGPLKTLLILLGIVFAVIWVLRQFHLVPGDYVIAIGAPLFAIHLVYCIWRRHHSRKQLA